MVAVSIIFFGLGVTNDAAKPDCIRPTGDDGSLYEWASSFSSKSMKHCSKRAARTTRPTSALNETKPIGERGKNLRPCLIVSQAAYLITRIPDIGLPGRAAREPIWSQYFPPLSNLCW